MRAERAISYDPHWTITWLDAVRERQGITKVKFASMLGVSEHTYKHWTLGINQPRVGEVEEMAKLLKLELVIEDPNDLTVLGRKV